MTHDEPVIWLHAAGPEQLVPLIGLIRRLGEEYDDLSFVLTSENGESDIGALPPRTRLKPVPAEASRPIASFLDQLRPDLGVWAGTALRPTLVHTAADRGMPLFLVGASKAPETGRGWRRLTGVTRATLKRFERILATDGTAARELVYAGADRDNVEAIGPFEEETLPLPCNLGERDSFSSALKARPVWLATSITEYEEEVVLAAHRIAGRLAHRLLLILSPENAERGPTIAGRAMELGFTVASRSVEGEPSSSTEVFIADAEGDLGLWYRLAPISFMGGTLDPAGGGGRSPLEPAALGSAILHGPFMGDHEATYDRFDAAGAARGIVQGAELAETLSVLLSPDRSAAMAHSAWQICTAGAVVTERVSRLIGDRLGLRAG